MPSQPPPPLPPPQQQQQQLAPFGAVAGDSRLPFVITVAEGRGWGSGKQRQTMQLPRVRVTAIFCCPITRGRGLWAGTQWGWFLAGPNPGAVHTI